MHALEGEFADLMKVNNVNGSDAVYPGSLGTSSAPTTCRSGLASSSTDAAVRLLFIGQIEAYL